MRQPSKARPLQQNRANLPEWFAEHHDNLDYITPSGITLADAFILGAVYRDAFHPIDTLEGLGLFAKYRHSRNY